MDKDPVADLRHLLPFPQYLPVGCVVIDWAGVGGTLSWLGSPHLNGGFEPRSLPAAGFPAASSEDVCLVQFHPPFRLSKEFRVVGPAHPAFVLSSQEPWEVS